MPPSRSAPLHHTVHRRGPHADWVILLHGAGLTSAIWEPQVDALRRDFHLLLPDLRGHGGSADVEAGRGNRGALTFEAVAGDVLDLMDHLDIDAAHVVAVSMGCIVARTMTDVAPGRVRSMVQVGAMLRLNILARILVVLAHALKRFVPHMWLYRTVAWILMPRPSHRSSRRTVTEDASRHLRRATFLRWLPLTSELPGLLDRFRSRDPGVPTLYVMGDQDHMFLPGIRAVAASHPSARLEVMEACGHVCTLERPETFNRLALEFLNGAARGENGPGHDGGSARASIA